MNRYACHCAYILENSPVAHILVNNRRIVYQANKSSSVLSKVSKEEMVGKTLGETIRCLYNLGSQRKCGYGPHCVHCMLNKTVMLTIEEQSGRCRVEASLAIWGRNNGYPVTFMLSTSYVEIEGEPLSLVVMEDISEFKGELEVCRKENREKDLLLKELNHRIKNNFALVSSLIGLKNHRIGAEADLSDIQSQVEALRLLHQKLCYGNSVTHIEIRDFVLEILDIVFSA